LLPAVIFASCRTEQEYPPGITIDVTNQTDDVIYDARALVDEPLADVLGSGRRTAAGRLFEPGEQRTIEIVRLPQSAPEDGGCMKETWYFFRSRSGNDDYWLYDVETKRLRLPTEEQIDNDFEILATWEKGLTCWPKDTGNEYVISEPET
jgi:hypothetical protein